MEENLNVTPQILKALEESDAQLEVDERESLTLTWAEEESELPSGVTREELVRFFSEKMEPWNDTKEDVDRGIEYAFSNAEGKGGFVLIAHFGDYLVGGVVMLHTAMKGYIPENLLLFVCVDPSLRGCGVGRTLVNRAVAQCEGAVKLHVEEDNPAVHLYERCGFEVKYLEMRRSPKKS